MRENTSCDDDGGELLVGMYIGDVDERSWAVNVEAPLVPWLGGWVGVETRHYVRNIKNLILYGRTTFVRPSVSSSC